MHLREIIPSWIYQLFGCMGWVRIFLLNSCVFGIESFMFEILVCVVFMTEKGRGILWNWSEKFWLWILKFEMFFYLNCWLGLFTIYFHMAYVGIYGCCLHFKQKMELKHLSSFSFALDLLSHDWNCLFS